MNVILTSVLVYGGIPLAIVVVGLLMKRYLLPWIDAPSAPAQRRLVFDEVARIADRLTDEALALYPNMMILDIANKLVDKLMETCNVSEEVAKRELTSQLYKKTNELSNKASAMLKTQ